MTGILENFRWDPSPKGYGWSMGSPAQRWQSDPILFVEADELGSVELVKYVIQSRRGLPSENPYLVPYPLSHQQTPDAAAGFPFRDNAAVFKQAIQTIADRKAIVAFANRYGSLGGDAEMQFVPGALKSDSEVFSGVPLELWEWEIGSLFVGDLLRVELANHRYDRLKRIFWLRGNKIVVKKEYEALVAWPFSRAWSGSKSPGIILNAERLLSDVRGDDRYIVAAAYLLKKLVGVHLENRTNAAFATVLRDNKTELQLAMQPANLIGAIWLQFALAIQNEADLRPCPECDSWFEVSVGRGRPDKKFCSDRCRMRASRKRTDRK